MSGAATPRVSVVIPTYDRREKLAAVLAALDRQVDPPPFEVVVVDDGSRDGTGEWLRSREGIAPLRALQQENRGPAAARNAGVREARGHWVAFLGDDTAPHPGWLAAMADAAENAEVEGRHLAVLGRTRWHPDIRVTPFLAYAEEEGLQFGYGLIEDPEDVPFQFFYTSNVLVHREAVLAEPFCEDFPYAAWEDTELAFRLQRGGLRMIYRPEALVDHDHPSSFSSFARRQEKAGYAAVIVHALHPELADLVCIGPEGPPPPLPPWARLRLRLMGLLSRLLEPFPLRLPGLWHEALRHHYFQGMRRAWRDHHG